MSDQINLKRINLYVNIMICRRSVLFIFLVFFSCKESPKPESRIVSASPRTLFPGLFEAVQSARIFPDSKTFPDCIPKRDPADILSDYRNNREDQDFNLRTFIAENFDFPPSGGSRYTPSVTEGVEKHIERLWDLLERKPDSQRVYSSLIALPHSYIVPGGRFREIYYWDSFFTMLGLQESGRDELIEDMVNNFAWLIRSYGFVPNGNRTYYLTRSQPPFFSLMIRLLMEAKKDKADSVLKANRDVLEKEYRFWMDDHGIVKGAFAHVVHLPDGTVLNRYFDKGYWPREESYREDSITASKGRRRKQALYRELRSAAESGWDFSSRWFADGKSLESIHTTDVIPVELNCLLFHLEKTLALCYQITGKEKSRTQMEKLAARRQNALERYCYDRSSGYFKDYDWKKLRQIDNITLSGMYPLYFKMAGRGQAASVASVLQSRFLKPGGLVTSLVNTGQQWDAPNGWAPLQYLAIRGLLNYRFDGLAAEISRRWTGYNIRIFRKTGKLLEKYNVVDTTVIAGGGEYPTQDGFGWTNGVLLKLLKNDQKLR